MHYKPSIKIQALQRGMTLLEVLIALAIFATAALSVIRAVSQHISTLGYLEQKTFASMVVDNQLALVNLSNRKVQSQKGQEELAGQIWYWQIVPVKTATNYIQAVDITVASDAQYKHSLLTVRSYVKE